jgi:hypothetical protein
LLLLLENQSYSEKIKKCCCWCRLFLVFVCAFAVEVIATAGIGTSRIVAVAAELKR